MPRRAKKGEVKPAADNPVSHPVDVHVGARIRFKRTTMGMSQEMLADQIGLTFQQVQKYERGANRVSASRLYEIAGVLHEPVEYFFEGLAHPVNGQTVETVDAGELTMRQQRALSTILRIRNEEVFDSLVALARVLVRSDPQSQQ